MKLLKTLIEQKVINTLLPSISIWLVYILISVVLAAVFSWIVAGMVFVLFKIIAYAQSEITKNAFHTFWYENLTIFKFHLVFVVIGTAVIMFIAKNFDLSNIFSNNENTKNGK